MGKSNAEIGRQGEHIAKEYLISLGMEILETNYHIRGGELDIIAKEGDCYVFAEVKTRTTHLFGTGADAITPKKKHALLRAAETYAARHAILDKPMRFDVLEVFIDRYTRPSVRYIRNAQIDT